MTDSDLDIPGYPNEWRTRFHGLIDALGDAIKSEIAVRARLAKTELLLLPGMGQPELRSAIAQQQAQAMRNEQNANLHGYMPSPYLSSLGTVCGPSLIRLWAWDLI